MQAVLSVGETKWETTYQTRLGKGRLPALFTPVNTLIKPYSFRLL